MSVHRSAVWNIIGNVELDPQQWFINPTFQYRRSRMNIPSQYSWRKVTARKLDQRLKKLPLRQLNLKHNRRLPNLILLQITNLQTHLSKNLHPKILWSQLIIAEVISSRIPSLRNLDTVLRKPSAKSWNICTKPWTHLTPSTGTPTWGDHEFVYIT